MSNLILPKDYTSPYLEANLAALFARYPHDRSRLETVLRKPCQNFPLVNSEIQTPPSKPPIRIVLMLGLINPQFLAAYLNDNHIRKECFKLFIFEQNAEFLAFCFQQFNLVNLINYPKTEWMLLTDFDLVKAQLYRAMKPEHVTSMMLNVQTYQADVPNNEPHNDFYDAIPDIYHETVKHVLHNHGNMDDSLLGLEITFKNKDFIINRPGIHDLKDAFKGASALIVGAGPSLDGELENIKAVNDKFVVIAVDAALKPLLRAGIRVDYVTSIERLNEYQKPFFSDLPMGSAELVAYPVVHPDVLNSFPGTVRLVYRNYSFYAYFERSHPKGILRSGGSTSHLGVRLADYMGCRRAFFIGLDSCYEEKDGLYRSHCSDTGHAEWGNYIELMDFHQTRKHQPAFFAVSNEGKKVATNITYYQWVKEYAQELDYLGVRMLFTNCSAGGLKIPGISYKPLLEAAKDLEPLPYEKPQAPAVSHQNRSWDSKDLLKNFEAWSELLEAGEKEALELSTQDVIPPARFDALTYIYNFRVVADDLFVSFVIQACATRFFELENKWWSYDLDFMTDAKEKCLVYAERFRLFKETTDRIIKIIREDG